METVQFEETAVNTGFQTSKWIVGTFAYRKSKKLFQRKPHHIDPTWNTENGCPLGMSQSTPFSAPIGAVGNPFILTAAVSSLSTLFWGG